MSEKSSVAYGYLRVSSDAQVASGLGLDAQLQRILAEQDRLRAGGAIIGRVYRDEAVSAVRHAMRDRPAGSALDAAVQAGDHVCIAMLDRAFRTQRDAVTTLESWLARGVIVHLLDIGPDTSTPIGQLTVGILAAVAQWESQRLGERIRSITPQRRENHRESVGVPTSGRADPRRESRPAPRRPLDQRPGPPRLPSAAGRQPPPRRPPTPDPPVDRRLADQGLASPRNRRASQSDLAPTPRRPPLDLSSGVPCPPRPADGLSLMTRNGRSSASRAAEKDRRGWDERQGASPMPLSLGPLGEFFLAERRKPPGFPTAIPDGSRRTATT